MPLSELAYSSPSNATMESRSRMLPMNNMA